LRDNLFVRAPLHSYVETVARSTKEVSSEMSSTTLLSRIEGVRQTGAGRWLARCPAHDEKHPSLSIRELDDGRVLVHCFAECATEQVLAAVGLQFDDLFPPRAPAIGSPPIRHPFPAADVLQAVAFEAKVVYLTAEILRRGDALSDADRQRLRTAVLRLQRAVEVSGHA
jgi:hypothetical protein